MVWEGESLPKGYKEAAAYLRQHCPSAQLFIRDEWGNQFQIRRGEEIHLCEGHYMDAVKHYIENKHPSDEATK